MKEGTAAQQPIIVHITSALWIPAKCQAEWKVGERESRMRKAEKDLS